MTFLTRSLSVFRGTSDMLKNKLKANSKAAPLPIMQSSEGFRDACEILGNKYVGFCNQLGEEPSEVFFDEELLISYLKKIIPSEKLLITMSNEYNQGFITGLIKATIDFNIEMALEEEANE